MPGSVASVVLLALSGALGLTLLVLSCALPQFNNFWPLFTLFFHLAAPVPHLLSKHYTEDMDSDTKILWIRDAAVFLTAGIVVSAFALPLLLAHAPREAPVIEWEACALVLSSNTVLLLTSLGLVVVLESAADDWYY